MLDATSGDRNPGLRTYPIARSGNKSPPDSTLHGGRNRRPKRFRGREDRRNESPGGTKLPEQPRYAARQVAAAIPMRPSRASPHLHARPRPPVRASPPPSRPPP